MINMVTRNLTPAERKKKPVLVAKSKVSANRSMSVYRSSDRLLVVKEPGSVVMEEIMDDGRPGLLEEARRAAVSFQTAFDFLILEFISPGQQRAADADAVKPQAAPAAVKEPPTKTATGKPSAGKTIQPKPSAGKQSKDGPARQAAPPRRETKPVERGISESSDHKRSSGKGTT